MTGGGGTARKPLNRRESALASIRATFTEFNEQNLAWERQLEELFDEAESVAMQAVFAARPEPIIIREPVLQAAEPNENLLLVANQQQELTRHQQAAVSELTQLRHLVEQQTELLKPEPVDHSAEPDEHLVLVACHQEELARQQQAAVSELTMLRHLVEQQTELLTAFIHVSGSASPSSKPRDTQPDAVVDAVQAQFEQLQKQIAASQKR